jgi:apolipoprotein N-acyltransferase
VIQPNIDPYFEKFDRMSSDEQLDRILKLAANKGDSTIDYFVAPETALVRDISETSIDSSEEVLKIKKFLTAYPKAKFVIGASTFHIFNFNEPLTPTARKFTDADMYYDCFNTALQIDTSHKIQIYHKSKLVIGVEKVPYPQFFKYISNFSINLGGASGSLGTQKHRSVLISPQDKNAIAPVVCYESIYGEYVTEYMWKGADAIFIITNDGWWGNTSGFKQHFNYARLRAIETRRDVARSANTGRSAFINQRGEAFQPTEWGKPDAIRGTVNANTEKTFYVKYGDFIGRLCAWIFLILLVSTIFPISAFKKKS